MGIESTPAVGRTRRNRTAMLAASVVGSGLLVAAAVFAVNSSAEDASDSASVAGDESTEPWTGQGRVELREVPDFVIPPAPAPGASPNAVYPPVLVQDS